MCAESKWLGPDSWCTLSCCVNELRTGDSGPPNDSRPVGAWPSFFRSWWAHVVWKGPRHAEMKPESVPGPQPKPKGEENEITQRHGFMAPTFNAETTLIQTGWYLFKRFLTNVCAKHSMLHCIWCLQPPDRMITFHSDLSFSLHWPQRARYELSDLSVWLSWAQLEHICRVLLQYLYLLYYTVLTVITSKYELILITYIESLTQKNKW